MQSYEVDAELVDTPETIVDPQVAQEILQQGYPSSNEEYPQDQYEQQENPLFSSPNDLKVIQEYNREENMPIRIKKKFWALASKSIKLGFWKAEDYESLFMHSNIIEMGEVMSKPRHKYTFADMQMENQLDLLVFTDFKRGIGMEKYKINERTLQATSVTQNIQGGGSMARKRGGVMSGIKSFFG